MLFAQIEYAGDVPCLAGGEFRVTGNPDPDHDYALISDGLEAYIKEHLETPACGMAIVRKRGIGEYPVMLVSADQVTYTSSDA